MISEEAQKLFGYASVLISIWSNGIYIYSILKGKTKPHFFTTISWVVPAAIVFLAQILNGAGPGSWATGVTCLLCSVVCAMSYKFRKKYIVKIDYLFLALSILAVALWVVTKNALYSVVLCLAMDVLGFIPTIRKSWGDPLSENMASYALATLKHTLSLFALSSVTLVTACFPAAMIVLNGWFCLYLHIRRKKIGNTPKWNPM